MADRHGKTAAVILALVGMSCGNNGSSSQPDASIASDCTPQDTESMPCGTDVGVCVSSETTRTCGPDGTWSDWSDCGGVQPVPELCSNALDDDCDGVVNNGCACEAIAPGAAGQLPIPAPVAQLLASPGQCRLYAAAADEPTVFVIDAMAYEVVGQIPVLGIPKEMALSHSGQYLAVWYEDDPSVSRVDTATLEVVTYTVDDSVVGVAAYDTGRLFVSDMQSSTVFLPDGSESTEFGPWTQRRSHAALAEDQRHIYFVRLPTSGTRIEKFELADGVVRFVDWDGYGNGYWFPPDHLYVSPGEKHAYFAEVQVDGQDLAHVRGPSPPDVLVESESNAYTVTTTQILDTELLSSAGVLPGVARGAATMSDDFALWYSDTAGALHYVNISDLIDPSSLGVREHPPEPLSAYDFVDLTADPIRDRLYGLDATRGLVVAIDTNTMDSLGAIYVGPTPATVDVSRTAERVFVGHETTRLLSVIDAETFSLEKEVRTPLDSGHIAVLSDQYVVVGGSDPWDDQFLIDVEVGEPSDIVVSNYNVGFAAIGDPAELMVASSGGGAWFQRFVVSSGELVRVLFEPVPLPVEHAETRIMLVLPDDSGFFYGWNLFRFSDLTASAFALPEDPLAVTGDSALVVGPTSAYSTATGTLLATLPVTSNVVALAPDGFTLYSWVPGGTIAITDLSSF